MITKTHSYKIHYKQKIELETMILILIIVWFVFAPVSSLAQPAKGANKFLGNITTWNAVRPDFLTYWNQITGENESKWATIEGTQDKMVWKGTDAIAEFSRKNGIPWKFHCLIWGSQYPDRWMNKLSKDEQLEEITEWLDSAAVRYPDVQMIDVINEAYPSHKPPPFKDALGGDGSTGFDWMIKIFKMARDRWPDAILIYNDYNTIEWNSEVDWQVKMANVMKKNNSEMDAIGVQAHDAWKIATSTVKSNIDKLAATGYPIFVTEYDIGESNDARQKQIMQEQFTMFWNHPKIVGITYWGYIVGRTWRTGTGLLNDGGAERPALTWLVDYVKKNLNPPNDYPDLVKEVTVDINSRNLNFSIIPARSYDNKAAEGLFDLQGRAGRVYTGNTYSIYQQNKIPVNGCFIIKNGNQYNKTVTGAP